MPISNWDPWRELERLRGALESAFEEYGRIAHGGGGESFLRDALSRTRRGRGYPLINVSEDAESVYVEALMPGVDPESLEVTVQGDTLRLAGEKAALSCDIQPGAFHRRERSAGPFVRTVTLPADVVTDDVVAGYRDGVLLVTLPKSEESKPKKITVNVGSGPAAD